MSLVIGHGDGLGPETAGAVADTLNARAENRGSYYCFCFDGPSPEPDMLAQLEARYRIDLNAVPVGFEGARTGLVISDMDSTLITIECVDELADFAGRKSQVAAITEAAMRGELDFATSLRERVRALAGLEVEALESVYEQRLRLSPGAETLITGLKQRGVRFALVSGGFTFFTDRLKERLGLDFARANVLEIQAGRLTGEVLGDVVDGQVKAAFLRECCRDLGIGTHQAVAMGDGANDLPMMAEAGLGVAYRAKPKVQAAADVTINYGGLDGLLPILDGCAP